MDCVARTTVTKTARPPTTADLMEYSLMFMLERFIKHTHDIISDPTELLNKVMNDVTIAGTKVDGMEQVSLQLLQMILYRLRQKEAENGDGVA